MEYRSFFLGILLMPVFLSQGFHAKSQNVSTVISRRTMNKVAKLASLDYIMLSIKDKTVGPKEFGYLINKASQSELVLLTDHSNPIVRVYSFWALVERKYKNLTMIYNKHQEDTAVVKIDYLESDISGLQSTVIDLMRGKLPQD